MGIILCKKHGRQGFDQVCEHIDNELKSGNHPQTRRLNFWVIVLVCDNCWKKFEIEKFENHPQLAGKDFFDIGDEFDENSSVYKEYEKVYNELNQNLKGWCLQCIAEVKVKMARKKSEPEPFPVYEKTLTHQQKEIVEELTQKLTENFTFQKSAYVFPNEERPALFIREGAFTYPLTITIYYVVDENEQNRIVEFISNFLDKTKFNQAKIKFYEAEVVETWETPHGKGMKKGEEKPIREVCLHC